MRSVAIIGGGFAGLAAGVSLAEAGVAVTLFEARPRLGGRAYSFLDEPTGAIVDNGQHAMMGCYAHTLDFLRRIGADGKLFHQADLEVEMADARRGPARIAFARLPGPAHAAVGITRYRLLTLRERMRALLGGMRLMSLLRHDRGRLLDSTVEEVLVSLGQSANARESFWYPVAIATLNERPEQACAAPFAEVLKRAFFASRAASRFILPRVGLSDLYTEDARRFIEERGGHVELKAPVAGLEVTENRVTAVLLRDGRRAAADACLCAVPPRAAEQLLPAGSREGGALHSLSAFDASPIVSTHLWWDRPVLDSCFVGLLGTTTQWAFNRSRLVGASLDDGLQAVSTVISAARDVVEWENQRITATVVADLRRVLPAARAARIVRSVVVKEKHATVSVTPATERLRPSAVTNLDNLFLAGDWIDTGLPPTIESAVTSGEQAARLVLGRLMAPLPLGSDRAASAAA